MGAMTNALVLLAVLGAVPAGKPSAPVIRHSESAPEPPANRLATADEVAKLCRALEPAERLRAKGDAVERGEAEAKHDAERSAALRGRYEVAVPAANIAFAPYDGSERRLALVDPVQLPVGDGAARLWPTEQRSLAVEADAAAARRVLDAQKAGSLSLSLVFDLPEDATCGTGARGKTFTVPVEPVSWRWTAGETVLAAGGAAAERPTVTAAAGAKPRVRVGDPITGPAEARKAVIAKRSDLEACYARALARDPSSDGVLVADLGRGKTTIAADSVGDPAFSSCVEKALAALALQGLQAAVPIRFELAAPGAPDPDGER